MGQRLGVVSAMKSIFAMRLLALALATLGAIALALLAPQSAVEAVEPSTPSVIAESDADADLEAPQHPASERQLVVINGADYFGHDYDTLQEVGLEDCEAACLADQRCRAFTFNTNAGWCFLKSSFGQLRAFDGAVSGYIQSGPIATEDQRAQPRSELAFLPSGYRDEADAQRRRIADGEASGGVAGGLDQILSEAQQALAENDPRRAARGYRVALRLAPTDPGLWQRLAEAALAIETNDWSERQAAQQEATAAAINAYLSATDIGERARMLALIGRSLEARSAWRPAIRAERASLALVDDPVLRARLEQLVAEHGFRIIDHQVSSDARNPRICIRFSAPLARDGVELADYLELDVAGLAIEPEAEQLCLDGVEHGERYRIRVRAGLPANDGERLAKPVELEVYVRDRSPAVRFPGRAYVLPSGGSAALPVVTVNTRLLDAALYRVGDRALGGFLNDETLLTPLSQYQTDEIAEISGEQLWKGEIETRSELNREVTTSVPVAELLADAAAEGLKPGVYILSARPADALEREGQATQWFVVSDLGLTALSADDGLHAFVRSLASAEPLADVRLQLLALNQQELGEARTDAQGYARFEPGLLRGEGGNRPALLVAKGEGADLGFLDLKASPFDLSDRGVEGRPAAPPIDTYLVSERGIYRPGETLVLSALTRDPRADAVTGVPLTFVLKRPDGVEQERALVPDQGLGGYQLRLPLLKDAMRGTWQAEVYADPKAEALAQINFLVEDFEPERLDFSVEPSAAMLEPAAPPSLTIDARFLYGAPAANLEVSGMTRVTLADGLADWPGWQFGLASEAIEDRSAPLPGGETDAAGRARLGVELPTLIPSTRPLKAAIDVQVLDGGGRPVERNLSLPIRDQRARIGLKPLFEGAVEQGGNARFAVLVLDANGSPIQAQGLRWTLSKVQTDYQWYRTDGDWRFEPIVSRTRVASGDLDVSADASRPAQLEASVDWGGYELRIEGADGTGALGRNDDGAGGPRGASGQNGLALVPASLGFEAGWYVAPKAFDTPDVLKVSLDKPEYRVGEQARVRLAPRFPGLALVMVIGDDGLVSMQPAEVPETGTDVEIPVTADWGAGAYVTAILYRGMDLQARRMPRRAIGLHWAGVDPEQRRLALALDVPEQARPREPLEVSVQLSDLAPGEEAYVTLAAVDVGILNLTRFEAWSPTDWYFGQRRLGAELRDLYGQLIDRMQGEPGRLRTGSGIGQLMSFAGPPPSEALVAFQTEPLRLDAEGRAEASFELPDFNGQVRLMAMAWSATGIGQTAADILVRDPIVATASMPRFLAPGDRSRILLELAHVEGPAGPIEVSLTSNGSGLRIENDGTPMLLELPEQGRAQLVFPVEALSETPAVTPDESPSETSGASQAPGATELLIRLVTPNGEELTKELLLGVRNLEPPIEITQAIPLAPGAPPLRLDRPLAAADALLPDSGRWLLSITGAGALDVPGILWALERYPFGCVEQLTSRALPLLYLDAVTLGAGLTPASDAVATGAPEPVREAIAQILSHQAANGSFGLWGPSLSPGSNNLWLDAYVTDFLSRAREQGYQVQSAAFSNALDNLRNQLSYAADFDNGGEGIAYALYVLARNSRVPVGDLRYYLETKLDAFATPMARAQLGAALALFGETERAAIALRSAQRLWEEQPPTGSWRNDFGSHLRDGAALLSLAAESGGTAVDLAALGRQLARNWADTAYPSTQEQAWMLLAAHALMDGAAQPRLQVNGRPQDGALVRHGPLSDPSTAASLEIANLGERSLTAMLTLSGIPVEPAPAGGNAYQIERSYYDLDGRRSDPTQLTQGERLVTLLTVSADQQRAARLLIQDPLPAGLEIDNPHLLRSGDVAGLPWLNLVTEPAHVALGSDRFAAAVDRERRDPTRFQLAYIVRAISPGRFAQPAARVEAMYQPSLRARTSSGTLTIAAPE